MLLVAVLALVALVPSMLLAQTTTGRIAGVVVDKQTGEPLPGANVIVEGTSWGAATDLNGEFIIHNIPAGVYNVTARFVGYQPMTIRGIRVRIGLTERVRFELVQTAIEAQAIEVVAERPLIEKTATNAVRIVDSETIENLPVRGTMAAAVLNPGVVVQDGGIYIRGSRADEVGYYVEGANVRDVFSGNQAATIVPDALQEIQVQTGGYNAQYGSANGGVFAAVLKSGTPDYHFSIRSETDNFTSPNKKRFGTYSYGYADNTITVSGPVPGLGKKVKFFFAGQNTYYKDRYRRFWTPFKFVNGVTKLPSGEPMWLVDTGLRGGHAGDTLDVIEWKGGNVPGATLNRFVTNASLTFDFSPINIRLSWVNTYSKYRHNGLPIMRIFNTKRLPITEYSDATITAKITHVISPKTFYTLSLIYHDNRGHTYDPFFKDNYWIYADSLENAKIGFPNWESYTNDPNAYDIYGFPFDRPGNLLTGYAKYKRNYIGANFDFTHQLKRHQIQFGGEIQYWTLRNWSGLGGVVSGGLLQFLRDNPDVTKNPKRFELYLRSLSPNNYGYDVMGNETDEGDFLTKPRHPLIGAFYIQDRYEFTDLVVNAGLRLDYYNMDQWEPIDYSNPGLNEKDITLDQSKFRKVKAFVTVSPRLGFAFPVTDRTKLHVQWGKFVQMPQMSQAYRGTYTRWTQLAGGFFYGNPMAWRVNPERTTQYEIGFAHQFATNASFDVTLFYKDIKDQLQTRRIFGSPESGISSYDITQNGDFATTKGMEFRFTLRRTNRVMGWINYTFSQAKGTGSYVNQASASLDQATNQITIITPLYFNQTHQGSISLDYRFGKDDGGPILERSGINLLFTFNSGHPYTLSTGGIGQNDAAQGAILPDFDARNRRPLEPIGSSTTPWNFYLDMKVDKTVTIAGLDVNFYVYVRNVFNTKNVINVYPRTGNAYSDGFLENPDLSGSVIESAGGEGYVMLYRAINLQNRQHYLWSGFRGTDLWGRPREIRFGVYINY
jgi:outer membrane receptor protein involved in Fe transport